MALVRIGNHFVNLDRIDSFRVRQNAAGSGSITVWNASATAEDGLLSFPFANVTDRDAILTKLGATTAQLTEAFEIDDSP